HHGNASGDLTDECSARPHREGFQRCSLHQSEIRFPSFSVWSNAARRAARYLSTSSSVSRTPDAPGTVSILIETVRFWSGTTPPPPPPLPPPCWDAAS